MPISKAETVILGSVSRQDQNTPAKICPLQPRPWPPEGGAYLRGMKLITQKVQEVAWDDSGGYLERLWAIDPLIQLFGDRFYSENHELFQHEQ